MPELPGTLIPSIVGHMPCKVRPVTLLKRDSNSCFPVNIAKFLGAPVLKNICEWLLLFCVNAARANLEKVDFR